MRYLLAVICLILLGLMPMTAQDDDADGRGLIVAVNWRGTEGIGSLNPLRCDNFECGHILDLLFPTLIGIDHETGTFTRDISERNALVTDWTVSEDGLVYTFTLRDDAFWSDGQPITAYDVFFSHQVIASEQIGSPFESRFDDRLIGMVPLDTFTIAALYSESGCDAIDYTNFPIAPAHAFDTDFADIAADFFNTIEPLNNQYAAWEEQNYDFRYMIEHPFNRFPSATSGSFQVIDVQPNDYIRLVSNDGRLAFDYIDPINGYTSAEMFINGDTNLLTRPAFVRRNDLDAVSNVQIATSPFNFWDFMGFNLADPTNPQSAFDEDGNPLEQGHHPIFADIRVRQAIQLAIDVQALLDAAVRGYGVAMPSSHISSSWAYDESLSVPQFDPVAAAALLHEAGWRDINGDGIRECADCMYAETGQPLSFSLMVDTNVTRRQIAATMIPQQLAHVGIRAQVEDINYNRLQQQTFDAYLTSWGEDYPVNPDQTDLFTRAADVLDEGWNVGSYHNTELDDLMEQARTLPGCDYDERAELYHQIQAILQRDQPFVWLYVPQEITYAAGNIDGFNPRGGALFWNIQNWIIR